MTAEDAIRWVDDNKGLIDRMAGEYVKYAPYDLLDYRQDAYTAALETQGICQKNPALSFGGVFRKCFKRRVARVTPITEESLQRGRDKRALKKGLPPHQPDEEKKKKYQDYRNSHSFPLDSQWDVPLETLSAPKCNQIDVAKVFESKVQHLCSRRERVVMELALGLTMDGSLSSEEIAERLGISRRSVREYETRVLKKVEEKCSSKKRAVAYAGALRA